MGRKKYRKRGEGTLYRRRNGLWAGMVEAGRDNQGRRIRRAVYSKDRATVEARLEALKESTVGWCPSCGSRRLAPDRWTAYGGQMDMRWCASCGCHFGVARAVEIVIPEIKKKEERKRRSK